MVTTWDYIYYIMYNYNLILYYCISAMAGHDCLKR